jgi:UDP-glucose 4-epimerase
MTLDTGRLTGQRCVVLGAGGFVGTSLCRRLDSNGASVVGFGRRSRIDTAVFPGAWVDGEFDDASAIARVINNADVVFHLLGGSNPSASNRDPAAELQTSLATNLSLITAAIRAKVGKLVFVSSGGTVYGAATHFPILEDAPTDPISAYGLGKLTIEKMLRIYSMIDGLDYTILRVANPYGPFQIPNRPQGILATIIQRALHGSPVEIWGDGTVVRDYLHVDDVCDALVRAAAKNASRKVFNVGSGVGRSLNEIVASVSDVLNVNISVTYKPGRSADIPTNILDCTRAKQLLGWAPQVDWAEGLRGTAAWLSRLEEG